MNRTEEYIEIGDTTVTSKPAMRMEIWKNIIDKAEAKSLRGSIKYLDDYIEFRYANDCANWKHMKKMILNAKGNQYSGGHFRENILFTSEIFDRIKNNQLVDADYLQGKYIIVDKLPSHSDYAGVSLNCQKIETLTPIVEDINNHHKSYLGNKVLFSYPGLVGGGSGSQADDILINGIKVKTARHKPKQTVFNSAWTADGEEWAVQEFVYAIHKKEFTKSSANLGLKKKYINEYCCNEKRVLN